VCRKSAHDDARHEMRKRFEQLLDRIALHHKRVKLSRLWCAAGSPIPVTLTNIE